MPFDQCLKRPENPFPCLIPAVMKLRHVSQFRKAQCAKIAQVRIYI